MTIYHDFEWISQFGHISQNGVHVIAFTKYPNFQSMVTKSRENRRDRRVKTDKGQVTRKRGGTIEIGKTRYPRETVDKIETG